MDFEEWADAYALDDEPCTRLSRRQDCEAAWEAATKAEREACGEIANQKAAKVLAQLDELLAAANNLHDVMGRYHTEQAFKRLMAVAEKIKTTNQ